MLASLLQVRTIAGAVESDLALLAATLGADAAVKGGTEAFLFAKIADRASQGAALRFFPTEHYGIGSGDWGA
jgi:hypothetical protein